MKKLYKITERSNLFARFKEFEEYKSKLIAIYDEFAKEHGIEARVFGYEVERLHIVPTQGDIDRFQKDCVNAPGFPPGVFKILSPIAIAWREKCAEAGYTETVVNPFIMLAKEFGVSRCSYEFFEKDGSLFCSFETDQPYDTPKGLVEVDEAC